MRVLVDNIQEAILSTRNSNIVLAEDDRPQDRSMQEVEVRDFINFLTDTSIIELKAIGRYYTWSN